MNGMLIRTDIAIIGAGIAGASLAAEIGDSARVAIIEGESQPGYHSTGRSAAFWSETYGGPVVQPLTTASYAYLADNGFLGDRGAVHIADADGMAAIEALIGNHGDAVRLERVDQKTLAQSIPGLRESVIGGLSEPTCSDIDVAGLHAHYLARAKRAGSRLLTSALVHAIRHEDGLWRLDTGEGEIHAPILVDAAGAWASEIAAMAGAQPIPIKPFRRTVIQLEVDPPAPASLPLVLDAAERFYFKAEAGGRIWLSPHDETPSAPCDAAPEELDIAIAIDRFERAVDWRVIRRERAWAGLRSFAPDRVPVYGFDTRMPGFFWFAGQGGFGIQTAPAAAMIGAAQLLRRTLPGPVTHIDIARFKPERFG